MTNIWGQIKSSIAVFSALLITYMSRVKAHNCDDQQFQHCMNTLEGVTDSGLTFATDKTELHKMCPDMRSAVRCIHRFTRSCWNFERHRHFEKLFRNTARIVHELCANDQYQTTYLKHSPCMSSASTDHAVCMRRYNTILYKLQIEQEHEHAPKNAGIVKTRREISDERVGTLCCGFLNYVDCTSHAMERKCGSETAAFSEEFIRNMSDTLITDYCGVYSPEQCGLRSSATINTSLYSVIPVAILSLITIFLS